MGDTNTDPIEEFNLTPNDMIYIPKYWHHQNRFSWTKMFS